MSSPPYSVYNQECSELGGRPPFRRGWATLKLSVICRGAVSLWREGASVCQIVIPPDCREPGAKWQRPAKTRVSSQTYKEIFTALGPVEPFHHRGGLHLLPLHAGDAAQLHGVALNRLGLRGHFHTHGEADAD